MMVRDAVIPQWPGSPASEALDVAQQASALGYRGVWFGETAAFDAGVLAGRLTAETPNLRQFVGPLPTTIHSGPQLAMLAGSVAALGSSVELILGTSSPVITQGWHGRQRGSVAALRDTLLAARAAMSGERTAISDGVSTTTGFRAAFPAPTTPVGLAALGPRSLRLAGEAADRVVLNFVTPDSASELIHTIESGAESAGVGCPPISVWMHSAVTPGAAGEEVARRFLSGYLRAPGYAEEFERQGFGEIVAKARTAPTRELASLCTDDLLNAVFAFGSPEAVRDRADAFESLGLEVAVVPVTADDPAGTRTLEALAPNPGPGK